MAIDINKLTDSIDALPPNFHIAVKVSKMLDDFNVNIKELSETISIDQSLTVQLLKLCNSAQYGFSKKIVTVNDAIAKLGFKTLKSLIFVAVSKNSFTKSIDGYGLEKGVLWKNSVACAVYSKYLAELSGYKDPETAFTAGLLRDIGKLIIHKYVKEDYDKILKLVNKEKIGFSEAEQRILGYNHAQIGAKVASDRNFPKVLEEAILYHHNPEDAKDESEDYALINIIHIADSLVAMLGTGIGNDGMMYNLDPEALKIIGISVDSTTIESLISDLVDLNLKIEELTGKIN